MLLVHVCVCVVGAYSSLSFSLVMAPKCGVRAGAQRREGGRREEERWGSGATGVGGGGDETEN